MFRFRPQLNSFEDRVVPAVLAPISENPTVHATEIVHHAVTDSPEGVWVAQLLRRSRGSGEEIPAQA